MKIAVTNRHIRAAKLSKGHRTPLEVAIMEMDCFEDVSLRGGAKRGFILELDGMRVDLPKRIQNLLEGYALTTEMKPFSFDLAVDNSHFVETEDYLLDSLDMGFEFGFA
ncbi:MAG: hypothetical protein D6722_26825 [Bacteroidetes bacterium]|nr:MAG: hypothetical protein D6722_26825 [Bacteroidota bacterium]